MKIKFMCTKHECNLAFDGAITIAERTSDIDDTIPFGSDGDKETGYYVFDLSEAWCPTDSGGEPIYNNDLEPVGYTDSDCSPAWKPILYL